jgi:hypothetical protein
MIAPSIVKKSAKVATLDCNGLAKSCLAISLTKLPEIRIIPTPPFPEGVAIAAIVSELIN